MKKRILATIAAVLTVGAVFTGCASNNVFIMDKGLPANQQVVLTPLGDVRIYALDDEAITYGYITSAGSATESVVFSPGTHRLRVQYNKAATLGVNGNIIALGSDWTGTVDLNFEFEPGFHILVLENGELAEGDRGVVGLTVLKDTDSERIEEIKTILSKKGVDISAMRQ
jgi:hypothetical protein